MKAVLVNFNYSPIWLFDYPEIDYLIYDRSDSDEYLKDFPKERIIKTKNVGNVDLDKLSYLVDHYDDLPDVFLWGKTNLFKYISKEEFDAIDKTTFQPLLTKNHAERPGISFYKNGMYHEMADVHFYISWLGVRRWQEWANFFHIPSDAAIPFPPGGNFILTKERVHRYPKVLYETMRTMLPYAQLPGEAYLCERSYYLLWR